MDGVGEAVAVGVEVGSIVASPVGVAVGESDDVGAGDGGVSVAVGVPVGVSVGTGDTRGVEAAGAGVRAGRRVVVATLVADGAGTGVNVALPEIWVGDDGGLKAVGSTSSTGGGLEIAADGAVGS